MNDKIKAMLMRHKSILGDASFLGCAIAITSTCLFFFDLKGRLSDVPSIEFDELLVLGFLLGIGLCFFAWRRIVEQDREIGRRIKAEQDANFLAQHDHLTKLPNRRRLQQALSLALERAEEGASHALLLLDLNGFKAINDIFGHARGDDVLRQVADRLSGVLRRSDILARTGGDEFAIIVHDLSPTTDAPAVARKIIDAFSTPVVVGVDEHSVGAGIGIALLPEHGLHPGELMRKADLALYRAKTAASSAFTIFSEEMDEEERGKERLRRELRLAVTNNCIVPHYQPIVDLSTGQLRSFEALARWSHSNLGQIPPATFIPLAEESGQIGILSDQLLRQACLDASSWPPGVALAFNISPTILRDPTFGLRLLAILGETTLAPNRLELEITESAATGDLDLVRQTLTSLQSAGVRIVIDDFGTGATSLAHLRSFKFDGLKIDQRFVDSMLGENESVTIVGAIIGLAKSLGLEVVAEGIEQSAQCNALQNEGCGLGQGFLFSKALAAEDALRFATGREAVRA